MSKVKQFLAEQGLDFQVKKTPVYATIKKKRVKIEDKFATYRTDTNQPLGIVGARYTIVNNSDCFDFIEPLLEENELILEKGIILNAGAKIILQAKLPQNLTLKNGDEIQQYICFFTSHDGSLATQVLITPIRLVCTNQLFSLHAEKKNSITIRHTKSALEKLKTAQEVLGLVNKQYRLIEENLNDLLNITLTSDEIDLILFRTFATATELECEDCNSIEEFSTRKQNIVEEVKEWYLNGIGQTGVIGTAYGLYQGLTGYFTEKNPDIFNNYLGTPSSRASKLLTEINRLKNGH